LKDSARAKWLILIAVLVAAFFIGKRFYPGHILSFPQIISWVERARTSPPLIAVFYVLFVFGVMVLPITLFPVIGGVLLNFWIALPLNLLAATLGGVISFQLTRVLGREKVHQLFQRGLKVVDHLAKKEGIKSVFILRLLGVPPFIVANYALGLTDVKLRDFTIGTAAGILPWITLVTFASHSLWQAALVGGEHGFRGALLELVAPFTIISAIVLVTTVIGLLRKRKQQNYSNL
jgi:uncharacterized membrane protein YdjX (TVP38/TMEM64 family)